MPRPQTKAEKAAIVRQRRVTWGLYEQLNKLPADACAGDVVRIFSEFKATPSEKYTAFEHLDGKPAYFDSSYFRWHGHLRRARNDPSSGLFKVLS